MILNSEILLSQHKTHNEITRHTIFDIIGKTEDNIREGVSIADILHCLRITNRC